MAHHMFSNVLVSSIRKRFCVSFNFLNCSQNWGLNFLKIFLTFIGVNWLEDHHHLLLNVSSLLTKIIKDDLLSL